MKIKKRNQKSENGEGAFRKRANGTLEYRIYYTDEYGKQIRKSFYGQNDIECKEKATEFLKIIDRKINGVDAMATIPEIVKFKYNQDLAKNYVHEQGYSRNIANLAIIEKSALGKLPIKEIKAYHIDMFLCSITRYSNSTISKIYLQLKMAFREAVAKKIITDNIMEQYDLRCPKSNKPDKKVRALTRDEQVRFVNYLNEYKKQNNRNEYIYQLLIELYSGMRMGEINALKPECIDLKRGVIHVRATVSRGENFRDFIKEGTKTEAGVRDIPISNTLRPVLEKALNNKIENPYGLLFYDEYKKNIVSTNQVNCFFQRVCEKCTIEKRGQHALRHTFATRCIEAEVPPVVLKNWLGHTDIHVTLDTYADVFDSMHHNSIEKLDSLMDSIIA